GHVVLQQTLGLREAVQSPDRDQRSGGGGIGERRLLSRPRAQRAQEVHDVLTPHLAERRHPGIGQEPPVAPQIAGVGIQGAASCAPLHREVVEVARDHLAQPGRQPGKTRHDAPRDSKREGRSTQGASTGRGLARPDRTCWAASRPATAGALTTSPDNTICTASPKGNRRITKAASSSPTGSGRGTSVNPVARKTRTLLSVYPGEVATSTSTDQSRAARPASSASSRCAVRSGSSPDTS